MRYSKSTIKPVVVDAATSSTQTLIDHLMEEVVVERLQFTLNDVMECLSCTSEKANDILQEMWAKKLIEYVLTTNTWKEYPKTSTDDAGSIRKEEDKPAMLQVKRAAIIRAHAIQIRDELSKFIANSYIKGDYNIQRDRTHHFLCAFGNINASSISEYLSEVPKQDFSYQVGGNGTPVINHMKSIPNLKHIVVLSELFAYLNVYKEILVVDTEWDSVRLNFITKPIQGDQMAIWLELYISPVRQ